MPRFDYTTVGHVTADVLADGARRAGGSAFYSALQAARLGRRALIITQGVGADVLVDLPAVEPGRPSDLAPPGGAVAAFSSPPADLDRARAPPPSAA